jgi:hypothetical protein
MNNKELIVKKLLENGFRLENNPLFTIYEKNIEFITITVTIYDNDNTLQIELSNQDRKLNSKYFDIKDMEKWQIYFLISSLFYLVDYLKYFKFQ